MPALRPGRPTHRSPDHLTDHLTDDLTGTIPMPLVGAETVGIVVSEKPEDRPWAHKTTLWLFDRKGGQSRGNRVLDSRLGVCCGPHQ